ncbi:hypothetical protein CMUS01_14011 [Colletotrichum musicola]|uniref:G domain-containing protein n=1 Tax=Colletotrichum musicola TaxID=2175873 RepID=A0A8H6J8D1_9PEZI|nr:hypothetical protein CMUS01_14011 [Colletotrichum musicola]
MTGHDDLKWLRGMPTPKHNDVYIAVMGVTGAGKSTFISHCTPNESGFDDTHRSDTDVLREIATWLSNSYKDTVKLHGIIYLHRITDRRLGGSAMRNLFMFQKLCGQDALKNVILVTTMWEDVKEEQGNKREEELKKKPEFCGGMIDKGNTVFRHQNNLQREMVDQGRSLDQTGAGQEVDDGLTKQRESHESHLETLQKELEEARASNDLEMARMLEDERKRTQAQMADLVQQRKDLKINLERLWEAKLSQLEAAHTAQLAEMESLRNEEKSKHELAAKELQEGIQNMQLASQICSINFHEIYPGAYRFLLTKYPDEAPTHVSLANDGRYFAATAERTSWKLPQSVCERLSLDPDCYDSIWIGDGGTFVAQREVDNPNLGQSVDSDSSIYSQECHLATGYPGLEDAIMATRNKEIKRALALNPLDSQQTGSRKCRRTSSLDGLQYVFNHLRSIGQESSSLNALLTMPSGVGTSLTTSVACPSPTLAPSSR